MRSERGIAMVLAITLMGLLSSLGIYLVVGSGTSYRISKAMQRSEIAFNMADAAVQLSLRAIRNSPPSPSFGQLNSTDMQPITDGLPSYVSQQNLGGGAVTPNIDYVGYKTSPPAGWMINWQGYSSFHSMYLRARGTASIPLPTSQGNAQSAVSALSLKVTR